ncbi:RNA polymerase III subunit C82 [Cladophialophora chaetospira]|uniref:DNA-directed RNA polymerase III subunit RPC3 n=1 Tax=Cladophialophora chaetospira TaxID=386627 RepID=A0AA38X0G2_9EURO|nr:RNA polymerase III subunit C82 [Cladophialophora chaetospira]
MEEFAKLCCHIVKNFYGSFLAEIFRQLTQFGRLSVQQIAQKCRLPLRQVKSGVATLIQLRLLHHHTSSDGQSTYQPNNINAYNVMRTGRLIELVNWKFGSTAADVLETLAAMGFATPHELELQVLGDEDLTIDKVRFRSLLKQLISSKYIKAAREAHFQSVSDRRQDAERFLRHNSMLPTGAGKKVTIDADGKIDLELEKRIDGNISAYDVVQELNSDSTQVAMSTLPKAFTKLNQDTTMLSIDFSNLIMRIRDDRVATLAEKVFGRHLAQVARAACSQIEDLDSKPLPVQLIEDPAVSLQRLDTYKIGADIFQDLTNGVPRSNGANGHHGRRTNGAMREDRMIEHQLALLAEGPFSFLLPDASDSSTWYMNKSKLNDFLWDKELHRLIGERLTEPALRIVRMLADKGKLDERTMLDVGLLNAKELRKCLAALQTMGFLELQEIPKDPQRQPKSTIFLYFYDPERVRKVCLESLYKAMSRMYERLHMEREKVSSLLVKVDRLEPGTEEDLLLLAELEELNGWRQKESWFTTEIHRIDDSIAILRDL